MIRWTQKVGRDGLNSKAFSAHSAANIDFIGNVIGNLSSDGTSQEQMVLFDAARSEAFFLFAGDTDLLNYLEELRSKSCDYAIFRSQAKGKVLESEDSKQRDMIGDCLYA